MSAWMYDGAPGRDGAEGGRRVEGALEGEEVGDQHKGEELRPGHEPEEREGGTNGLIRLAGLTVNTSCGERGGNV